MIPQIKPTTIIALLSLLALTACNGGGGGADSVVPDITSPIFGADSQGLRYIGVDRCLACHDNRDVVGNQTYAFTQSYLAGRHAGPGTVGADAAPSCLACHDPNGDGRMLAPWFAGASLPAGGMAAVGCEACHGAGPAHLAIIPNHPNPTPDFNACGRCHGALPSGVAGHTGHAANLFAAYQRSKHAVSAAVGPLTYCSRCHSDEGYRTYRTTTAGMDAAQLESFFRDQPPWLSGPSSSIQCRTCHQHDGRLRAQETVAVEGGRTVVKYSKQFNLCTFCHQVFLTATFDPARSAYTYTLDTSRLPMHATVGANGRPQDPLSLTNWENHYAYADGSFTGYMPDPASDHACTRCHDPHAASRF